MARDVFSCLIPFYNEGKQLLSVVEAVSRVNPVIQIILIDDGSTDNISEKIINKFKKVELVKLDKNQGKSIAVRVGLKKAINENILMLDADYQNVNSAELKEISELYLKSDLDMLLLQVRGGNNWLDILLRKEVLFTGFRILRKSHLEEVFNLRPKGYQLEVSINEYMIRQNKKVMWSPTQVTNLHKSQKWGTLTGVIKSIQMELSIILYLGLRRFLYQVLFFGKTRLIS